VRLAGIRNGFTARPTDLYSKWSLKRPMHHGLKTVCRANFLALAMSSVLLVRQVAHPYQ
jgi:hypothetical protein